MVKKEETPPMPEYMKADPDKYHLVRSAYNGALVWEAKDTPFSCSVASETYWSS